MENGLKGLMISVGIIITCSVISLGFYMLQVTASGAKEISDWVIGVNSDIIRSEWTQYDGCEVNGSIVYNIVKKYKDHNIGILVKTSSDTLGSWYYLDYSNVNNPIEANTSVSNLGDKDTKEYANPVGKFKGSLLYDDNGVICSLVFEQK